MSSEREIVYSQVDGILNLLGDNYIKKLPQEIYQLIKNKKSKTYNQKIILDDLKNNNVCKETVAMIALFHTEYWCSTLNEKNKLQQMFKLQSIENEKKKAEKYNPNNLFKQKEEKVTTTQLKVYKQNKVIVWIKKFFGIH